MKVMEIFKLSEDIYSLPTTYKKVALLKQILSKPLHVSKAKQALTGILDTTELTELLGELENQDPNACAIETVVNYIKIHHPEIERYFRSDFNDENLLPGEYYSPLGHKDEK